MRKLVTIRKISNLEPIKKADRIEVATIDGWKTVVKKGEFQVGDTCLYFEIDSWLPADNDSFDFLRKGGVNTDHLGKERIPVRTAKLRGQISQGLALPLNTFSLSSYEFNKDYAEELDVIKYERPEPIAADAAAAFPLTVPKTEAERIQNIFEDFKELYGNDTFIPTLKLDGTSCTIISISKDTEDYYNVDKEAVLETSNSYKLALCSHNLQLKINEDNSMFKAIKKDDMFEKLGQLNKKNNTYYALQGEVMGPGIQKNREQLPNAHFFAFNLYDLKKKGYVNFETAIEWFQELGIPHTPVLEKPFNVFQVFDSVESLIDYAEGESLNSTIREGVVFKSVENPDVSFKAISNKFLLKGGDD